MFLPLLSSGDTLQARVETNLCGTVPGTALSSLVSFQPLFIEVMTYHPAATTSLTFAVLTCVGLSIEEARTPGTETAGTHR